MSRTEIRSGRLYQEAVKRMPGGVNSPVRAFQAVGCRPLFIDHAKGSKIYDADGNEYIDYVCSWGPNILGHACEDVIKAVQRACEGGLTFGAPTERETMLAEMIQSSMPSMELLRLVNSGTEAVMSAIRVARGFTGRDKIVKFRGCYHGHSDGLLVKAGSGALTGAVPDSLGVPKAVAGETLIAEYNDIASVRSLFEKQGNDIAAIIVEPVAANMGVVLPADGFLQDLRSIADQYRSLLIFDEVITGFRLGTGGAQERYRVRPDLTTLGKIIGGGMPLAAYGGKREIMEMVAPLGGVYQAGTLSGNPVAVTAGIETIKRLQEADGLYEELEDKTAYLAKGFEECLGEKVQINRIGSLMSVFFTNRPVTDYATAVASDTTRYAEYFRNILDRGIYVAPSQFEAMFVSAAHTGQDIDRTIEAVGEWMRQEH